MSDADLALAKDVLRAELLARRRARTAVERGAADDARTQHLRARLAGDGPATVACYLSAGSEPDTRAIVGWLHAHGVSVLLPVVSRHPGGSPRTEPAWATYAGPEQLREGRRDIREPSGTILDGAALAGADLVIVPGLAGTRRGERLGRGGGWYDRALPARRPGTPVWLVLDDDEVLDRLPVQSWDQPVDALVTPTGVTTCR